MWRMDRLFPPDPTAYLDSAQQTEHEWRKASRTLGTYLSEMPSTDITVLDFGCGWGGETLWLATQVTSVVGVDTESAAIAQANRALASSGATNCRFEQCGSRLPFPDNAFDAVFSTDTFEHVMDLDAAFSELFRVLRPGGVVLSRFGPLFFSPHGYHLYWACKIPYAHLLFGLNGVLTLRNARCPSPAHATSWQTMGLNGRRFREYRRSAVDAGFAPDRFRRIPVRNQRRLAALPIVGDLLTFGIDLRLRKPARS
jgi:SAM-dependent methyltransferase